MKMNVFGQFVGNPGFGIERVGFCEQAVFQGHFRNVEKCATGTAVLNCILEQHLTKVHDDLIFQFDWQNPSRNTHCRLKDRCRSDVANGEFVIHAVYKCGILWNG